MSELATKIKQTIEELTGLEAVNRHFQSLLDQESAMVKERDDIESLLTKELKDVEKFENAGITSIFYKVLGSKEQQLEKERQEYLQISLKHTEHLKSLKLLRYEKEIIQTKVHGVQDLKNKLEALKVQREQEIMRSPSRLREQLMVVARETDIANTRIGTLNRSMKKGEAAVMSLDRVIQGFKKAAHWGNWDMGNRRGNYGHRKHPAINNAVNEANRTNMLLNSFTNDLNAIGYKAGRMSVGFKSFSGFMDVLFDNLISDWIIQNKIKNALSNTQAVRDRVISILRTLNSEVQTHSIKIEELAAQKDRILES